MSRAALFLILALVLDADSGAASFGDDYRAGLYHDRPGEATSAACRFDDFKLTTWSAALSSAFVYDTNNPYLLNRHTKPDGSYVDYGYDGNGDMTSMQRRASGGALLEDWGYEYSDDRFVKKVTLGGVTKREYERQGDSYMVRRDFTAGAEKRYVRDGDSVLVELNDSNQVTATYFGGGMDKMLSETRGGVTKWNLAGPGGSVMAVADVSGDIVSRYRYDAFGKRNAASSGIDPVAGQRTFQGRPHDEGLGLTNFRNRWYDPETGRFAQWDKVEDGSNWGNSYNFVDCDPVNNADPMGMDRIRVHGSAVWWDVENRRTGRVVNKILIGSLAGEGRVNLNVFYGGTRGVQLADLEAEADKITGLHPELGLQSKTIQEMRVKNAVARAVYAGRPATLTPVIDRALPITQGVQDVTLEVPFIVHDYWSMWINFGTAEFDLHAGTNIGTDIRMRSMLGSAQTARIESGRSVASTAAEGSAEVVLGVLSLGTGNMVKAEIVLTMQYNEGLITFEEYQTAMDRLAGAQTAVLVIHAAARSRSGGNRSGAGPRSGARRTGPRGLDPNRHNANVQVRNARGKLTVHERIVSGKMTPREGAQPFPKNTLSSHTEARAVAKFPLRPGQTMKITGQRPSCPTCKGVMNRAVTRSGGRVRIIYRWRSGGETKTWTATPKK